MLKHAPLLGKKGWGRIQGANPDGTSMRKDTGDSRELRPVAAL